MPGDQTNFGFRTVDADEKAGLVRGVFDSVADRYDLMNDLMSGGLHRVWKSTLLDRIAPQPASTLLDLAGGTADVARGFLGRANARPRALNAELARASVCDVNEDMLRAGRARDEANPKRSTSVTGQMDWVAGDAEALPFPDGAFDVVTIAFGIRNVTSRAVALREARRVLKFGGQFACLEFSHPVTEHLQRVYDAFSFSVIPALGERVTGDRASYRYLVESIRRFPTQEAFAAEIEDAGFERVRFENLTGGIASIHRGWRL